MGGGGVEIGYQVPFVSTLPMFGSGSSAEFFPYHQGNTLMGELEAWIAYGAVELALLSPGFTAIFSLVPSASRSWRPLLDLSSFYESVLLTHLRMELHHSVLCAIKRFAWMNSIDLKDACLQVPIHPDSHKFLRCVVARMSISFEICASVSIGPSCSSGS